MKNINIIYWLNNLADIEYIFNNLINSLNNFESIIYKNPSHLNQILFHNINICFLLNYKNNYLDITLRISFYYHLIRTRNLFHIIYSFNCSLCITYNFQQNNYYLWLLNLKFNYYSSKNISSFNLAVNHSYIHHKIYNLFDNYYSLSVNITHI